MKILLRKSVVVTSLSEEKTPDKRLEYFKGLLMDHLERLSERKSLKKSLLLIMTKGGKGLPVGSIREWKGKKYIKTPSGKWKPHGGGASKTAEVKEQIASARNQLDLFHIVEGNKDLFSDAKGKPLPVVMDLFGEIPSPKTPAPKKNTPSKKLSAKPKLQEAGADLFAPPVESKPKTEPEMPNPAPKNNPLGWSDDFPKTLEDILDYVNKEANKNDIEYVSDQYFKELPESQKDWLISRYAGTLDKNPTPAFLWKEMTQEINNLIRNGEISLRINFVNKQKNKQSIYKKLMHEFVIKNQFETGTSGGAYDKKCRDKWESVIAGKDISSMDSKERPIYAAVDVLNDNNNAASQYGRSVIVFKDSIRGRITFTIGNSSLEQGSFQKDANTLAYKRDRLLEGYGNPFRKFCNVVDGSDYIEAQIWGRAGIDDIAELRLDEYEYDTIMKDNDAKNLIGALKAKGIEINLLF
jgi:hypothetical protein